MVRDILLADLLANYAELLERGFYSPDWASGHYELNADEEAWIEELEAQAAIDEIRITHTWKSEAGGWTLTATIAPPRHDREYRLPKLASDPLWRQRFELDWGTRLAVARRRVAAERAAPPLA